jgi:hypothetical protein
MSASAALMLAALARAARGVSAWPFMRFAAKAAAASAAVGALLWAGRSWIAALNDMWAAPLMVCAAAASAVVYGGVLVCLRAEEALEIGRIGRSLLRR